MGRGAWETVFRDYVGQMMEFVFIMALGLICYFIGFFFGRVTKNRMEMRKDECKTYKDIIDREG